ncbi:MAG: VWA domain-containing protein [Gammaproteobacteria bacterium]|nr:VWA domain-containing protein [Gammaproteobacteria bacterium]MDP2141959.1 VWA domain-containing protein [Gammaproteobacteria bacterium]MDP2347159.1 VWA domain-containing protein [Gammaproteobacteria bacterium]
MSGSDKDLIKSDAGKTVADKSEIAAFLQKVAALPPVGKGTGAGRLLFGLDATGSREHTWDQASKLQAEMFLAAQAQGGLQVQLTYFRGFAEFYKTPWCRDSAALLGLMTGIQCRAGTTQIERVLRHALAENREQRIHCLVYVGDAMEENADVLAQLAGQLGILNVPVFLFQEGGDPLTRNTFQMLAKASRGAYSQFDSASADQLRELLRAVAVYASGGLQALENFSRSSGEAVKRLSRQMGV